MKTNKRVMQREHRPYLNQVQGCGLDPSSAVAILGKFS